MIRYALACEKGHGFESWFRASADYDAQKARGLVTCPVCGSARVEKQIMAPSVARKDRAAAALPAAVPASGPPAVPPPVAAPTVPAVPAAAPPVELLTAEAQDLRRRIAEFRAEVTKNATDVGERFAEVARQMHYGEVPHASVFGQASPDEARALAEEGIEFHPLPVLPDDLA